MKRGTGRKPGSGRRTPAGGGGGAAAGGGARGAGGDRSLYTAFLSDLSDSGPLSRSGRTGGRGGRKRRAPKARAFLGPAPTTTLPSAAAPAAPEERKTAAPVGLSATAPAGTAGSALTGIASVRAARAGVARPASSAGDAGGAASGGRGGAMPPLTFAEARARALEPKVMVPYSPRPGLPPRKVEVERLKRLFAEQDVEALLAEEGVDYRVTEAFVEESKGELDRLHLSLPLEAFDDTEYELRPAAAWMALARDESGAVIGLPAKALHADSRRWRACTVQGWDEATSLFTVRWDAGGDTATLPRIHLLFASEDPFNFARRVAAAHTARRAAEALLRYNLYIDCMPTDDTAGLDSEQVSRVLALALNTKSLKQNAIDTTNLLNEVNIDYMRAMNKIVFDISMAAADGDALFDHLSLPPPPPVVPPRQLGCVVIPEHNFPEQFNSFVFSSFLTKSEIFAAIVKVRTECIRISAARLFGTSFTKSLRLDEFEHSQNTTVNATSSLLRENWTTAVKNSIRGSLKAVGKGWFNMEERHREVYEFSKLKSFLTMVNFMMQDTLRFLTEDSLCDYTAAVEAAASAQVDVVSPWEVSVVWPERAIIEEPYAEGDELAEGETIVEEAADIDDVVDRKSEAEEEEEKKAADGDDDDDGDGDRDRDGGDAAAAAGDGAADDGGAADDSRPMRRWKRRSGPAIDTRRPPLFAVELSLTEDGHAFQFVTATDAFCTMPLSVFDRGLLATQEIVQVEKLVMNKLFWSHEPLMASVYPSEAWVVALRARTARALQRAVRPLRAYVSTYDRYLDFLALDVEAYGEELESKYASSLESINVSELRKLAKKHMAEEAAVLSSVPTTVQIGMFYVSVGDVRKKLAAKHERIYKLVLSLMAGKAGEAASAIVGKFVTIRRELGRFPNTIEELVDIKRYMAEVPELVSQLRNDITRVLGYYSVLDGFRWELPGDEFRRKWELYRWPKLVADQLVEVGAKLERERVRHGQLMKTAQEEFAEALKTLESEVQNLTQFTDLSQVEAVAAHVRSIKSRIRHAEEQATLFNTREGLFGKPITTYSQLTSIAKTFEPFCLLWETVDDWQHWQKEWTTSPFLELDAGAVESNASQAHKNLHKTAKTFGLLSIRGCLDIATEIKDAVAAFLPHIPLITALRNPGIRDRHWEELSRHLGFELKPDASFTLQNVFELGLQEHFDIIVKIGETAGKEYQIEEALSTMMSAWESVELDIHAHRETGTDVVRGVDEVMALLDEHITMTQAMTFSAFKKPFEEAIDKWDKTLSLVSEVLDEWVQVQSSWLYLQPIFDSPDINKQLPQEGKRFATVDKNWRQTMAAARARPAVIKFCNSEKLLEKFQESRKFLDMVQKGLSEYLETKRSMFARFYFLSDDDLLEILSETKDPTRVQPHLSKCIEAVKRVEFGDDLLIHAMVSSKGERVAFSSPIDPNGKPVECWMVELEDGMRESVKRVVHDSIVDYLERPRTEWMQSWPGQCVLNGSQTHWTREVEEAMAAKGNAGIHDVYQQQLLQLNDMVDLVRGHLEPMARITLGAMTVIDVHARDVTKRLADEGVATAADFLWISQLRYYWEEDDLYALMVTSRRPYGYEYIGNSLRLVITPLTDKCYLTLMGALQMILGGAPAGPAGTGKTETTKDLAKALAKQCVVFNCSDGLDYLAMGKLFKGLASCGAWACFDEFNRIDVEVLSVVAQQILTLQTGVQRGLERIVFEDTEIKLNDQFAVFITMNPGYAGRTELPDNLKALFRPVAMMVPDYGLIGEIMLYSFGFKNARICARKMAATFRLCSEQLSAQDHYDYGMRAVKTVITAAGNLKRADPDMDEETLLLRALQDVNVPKFLAHDLPLFRGIMSDLFPGKTRPEISYDDLRKALKLAAQHYGLQPVPQFLGKCIQLYETICVRHGLMVVGPTGGGKSSNIKTLAYALSLLKRRGVEGPAYERILRYHLNPKAITMGQLYGEFDKSTHEWQDGVLASIVRNCARSTTPDRKWVVFDGPVDAIWIENMNTVLDDNKKLCLNSGQIVSLSDEMTMMFEPEDLAVASPATVSRCGMVYMEPHSLGRKPLIASWLARLPSTLPQAHRARLQLMFDTYLEPALVMLRRFLPEPVPTRDNSLTQALMNILDCYLEPFRLKEGRDPPKTEAINALAAALEPLFLYALIWSVGASTTTDGRRRFDAWLRATAAASGVALPMPEDGLVYDWVLSWDVYRGLIRLPVRSSASSSAAAGGDKDGGDGGESKDGGSSSAVATMDDDDDDAGPLGPESLAWLRWMDTVPAFTPSSKLSFAELIIPTKDTVRYTFLLDILLRNDKHVLVTGPTGTGKTVNINQHLQKGMPATYIPLCFTFSAQTSANQTQDLLDGKTEKRRKGVFGPPTGKKFIIFVDDVNMPQREKYFAQPPIELLRQWMDYGGWYNRKDLTFRRVIDSVFVCACGPPGGGRNPVTPRFFRHFNMIAYTEMADDSMATIYASILSSFLASFAEDVSGKADAVVWATIAVYRTILAELLPTPAKCHYTFNLRDLGKVFQGLLMADNRKVTEAGDLLRMWVHECRRVFADRLVNEEDSAWFNALLRQQMEERLEASWEDVLPAGRLIYGDYMVPGADPRIYERVRDLDALVPTIEEYLIDYNAESKTPMKLVMFLDAIEHVSRISRIIRQPQGNALLLGVGGSGRQSLTRLARFMAGYELYQVEISKGYAASDWREDLKTCLLKAGLDDKPVVFLFSDTQIVDGCGQLEDVNNILNSGDVPNLYGPEEMDRIIQTCRVDCQRKRIPATKLNIFSQYLARVRRNIHVVLCMSPVGEEFRNRLRMFPSLVNCCTIDYFSEWPEEALRSVALSALTEVDLKLGEHLEGVVSMFVAIHQSVATASVDFFSRLRRHNYVTPTSYLELLATYKKVLQDKRTEVGSLRSRLQIGLDRLVSTAKQVGGLQEQLTVMEPQLIATQGEVEEMIVRIEKDKLEADDTKTLVEKEEAEAQLKAAETGEIAESAQRDLDEALPALDEAVKCLNKLQKRDLDELKHMTYPPERVKLTMQATCIMFRVAPVMRNDPSRVGKKIPDWWEAAKSKLLNDPLRLLKNLKEYDKDNIPDRTIAEISPFIDNPQFTPEEVDKASQACTPICMWVRAMHKYHFVARAVEPKRKALAEAQESLNRTMATLKDAKARLQEVEDRIADLQASYEASVAKKEQLARDVEECRARLERAQKLIGGLGGEKDRWTASVAELEVDYTNLVGDTLVASGTIAYLGPFTPEFRSALVSDWQGKLVSSAGLGPALPHSAGTDIRATLADPVLIRQWTIFGLPTDAHSVENGIIMARARRWPLLIDPQGQANRYIKNMGGEEAENGLDVIKLSDKNFLRTLENGVRFGRWVLLENIEERLDAALEPLLLQQKFRQGQVEMIKVGDSTIPYSEAFRFFMTTKLPNPHYPPEVCVKVSLLNFTITPSGLEDQLLGVVVVKEMPELEEKKNTLVVSNARMKKELQDLENKILFLLSNSKGNILDDHVLIETLASSKKTSEEINVKVAEAEETEVEIDATRNSYRPVAVRGSLLYFCISELADIDPMYQYSLQWFTALFTSSIERCERAPDLETRIDMLNEKFSEMLYANICRSLFEKHKLLFSFLMCIKILNGRGDIDAREWRFLISGQVVGGGDDDAAGAGGDDDGKEADDGGDAGGAAAALAAASKEAAADGSGGGGGGGAALPNPDASWVTERMWNEVSLLSQLRAFAGLAASFSADVRAWKAWFDSAEPHKLELVGDWEGKLAGLQRLCLLRALRPDKMMEALQAFVVAKMGQKYVEPPPFDLAACFEDSGVTTPLIFVLSSGSDPTKEFYQFAEAMRFGKKAKGISLGQGQGTIAAKMIEEAKGKGAWVLLQNCHLAASWMSELERICENTAPEAVHKDYRLWLTSMPSKSFPVSVLQNGVKMTNEPPKGLRANLKNAYFKLDDSKLELTNKPHCYKKLLFGLCFFHAVVQERRKFGPLGWNIPYQFNESDLDISRRQLEMFLNEYDEVPYKVLNFLTAVINYGGRVTDDKDIRTIDTLLRTYFTAEAMKDGFAFSESGIYISPSYDSESPHASFMAYIDGLPINADPEVFGMHSNANITCAQNETWEVFDTILSLQPRSASGGGVTREETISGIVASIRKRLPPLFDVESISITYPVLYRESMNTVLVQECHRYNNLLADMLHTLPELDRALKGLAVMSAELEDMATALFNQWVPDVWERKAYPSLKPLTSWVTELLDRLSFISTWVRDGQPSAFWLPGFFFPQAFLTGTLQNYARKHVLPIDTLSFTYHVVEKEHTALTERPEDGVYIYGLFLEGARWDYDRHCLADSLPKQLYAELPAVHLDPVQNETPPTEGIFKTPVYKVLSRRGELSTTGHSTNFVCYLRLPAGAPEDDIISDDGSGDNAKWIKRGVACFCALRY